MGHIRLGVLPKYPRWKQLISLMADPGSAASDIGSKVVDNSVSILEGESAQWCVSYCIWVIAQLTLAARNDDLQQELERLGIRAGPDVSAVVFVARVSEAVSRELTESGSDLFIAELASLSLRETFARTISLQATSLFGKQLDDVGLALAKYSSSTRFGELVHTYLTVFLTRVLRLVTDKELANHVGPGRRFESLDAARQLDDALETYASHTSRIVDTFSRGWHSKRLWTQHGAITDSDVDGFVHVALRKLCADLRLSEALP